MKTWALELIVVAGITFMAITYFRHSNMEYVGWLAVLATFAHAQVSDRMAEKQSLLTQPDVECYRWAWGYYLIKEISWFIYFIVMHSYAALFGCIIFLVYPFWRRVYRKFKPLQKNFNG